MKGPSGRARSTLQSGIVSLMESRQLQSTRKSSLISSPKNGRTMILPWVWGFYRKVAREQGSRVNMKPCMVGRWSCSPDRRCPRRQWAHTCGDKHDRIQIRPGPGEVDRHGTHTCGDGSRQRGQGPPGTDADEVPRGERPGRSGRRRCGRGGASPASPWARAVGRHILSFLLRMINLNILVNE
jgi:hypothetical protein